MFVLRESSYIAALAPPDGSNESHQSQGDEHGGQRLGHQNGLNDITTHRRTVTKIVPRRAHQGLDPEEMKPVLASIEIVGLAWGPIGVAPGFAGDPRPATRWFRRTGQLKAAQPGADAIARSINVPQAGVTIDQAVDERVLRR